MAQSSSAFWRYCIWWGLFLSLLVPFAYITYRLFVNDLGAEPAKALVEYLGESALWVLFATLLITPVSRLRFVPSLVRYRRMVGLFVFFYACLHVVSYALFLIDWDSFLEDLYKRKYISVGAAAFLIIFSLAITSPKIMAKKLGRKWKSLHKAIYLASVLVVVHVIWQVRSDYSESIVYICILLLLLVLRWSPVVQFMRKKRVN
jgi:sulfoxide reductase heme-binding subunit YedZ